MRIQGRFLTLPLVVTLLVLPRVASADDHKADWSGGPSFGFASTLFGAHTTVAVNPYQNRYFGLVADLSVHHGEHDGEDATRTTNLYGVRLMAYSSAEGRRAKHVVSVQALAGFLNPGGGEGPEFAGAVGVLYDYLPNDGPWGFRGQVDYVIPKDTDGFTRVSAGVVYRFERQ